MVLVDASHPDLFQRAGMRQNFGLWRSFLVTRQRLMPFGVTRLMGWCDQGTPQPALRTVECRSSRYEETLAELDNFAASGDQASALRPAPLGSPKTIAPAWWSRPAKMTTTITRKMPITTQ